MRKHYALPALVDQLRSIAVQLVPRGTEQVVVAHCSCGYSCSAPEASWVKATIERHEEVHRSFDDVGDYSSTEVSW